MSEKKVYVAESGDKIKIGVSKDPESRINQLTVGNPDGVELREVLDSLNTQAKSAERWESNIHEYLSEYRVNGEWFEIEAIEALHEFLGRAKTNTELTDRQATALGVAKVLQRNFPENVRAETHTGREKDLSKPSAQEQILEIILETYGLPHGVCRGCEWLAHYHESDDGKTCQRCGWTKQ